MKLFEYDQFELHNTWLPVARVRARWWGYLASLLKPSVLLLLSLTNTLLFFVSMTISSTKKNWVSDDNDETQEIFSARLRNLISLIPTARETDRIRYIDVWTRNGHTCKSSKRTSNRAIAGIVLSFDSNGIVGCAYDTRSVWCDVMCVLLHIYDGADAITIAATAMNTHSWPRHCVVT